MKLNWILFSLISCLYSLQIHAQVDTDFWFVVPEVAENHGDRPVFLRISTLAQAANITIEMPANSSFPNQNISVSANSLYSLDLTQYIDIIENKPANQVLNKGLHITSSAPITAYYEVNTSCNCNPDIFPLKGKNALGTSFWIVAQNFWRNALGSSSFDIVATEDGTEVTINPTADIIGHGGNQTFSITLNKGETYSATASGTAGASHLMGSRVTSSKKIAITLKDDSMQSDIYGPCYDLMGDQMVPEELAGQEFIVMKGYLGSSTAPADDKIFITATQDNTEISIAGNVVSTIFAGSTFAYDIKEAFTYVTTSAPVHILQITGFGCELGGSILPSIDCTGSDQVSFVRSTSEFFAINIMVETAYVDGFKLRGNSLPSNSFIPVPNTDGKWMALRRESADIPVGQSILTENTAGKFHLGIINGDALTGCRYGYFSNYGQLSADITSNAPVCEGTELRLEAKLITNGVYTWEGPNSFTSSQRTVTIPNMSNATIGTYGVTVQADGCKSELETIDVSLKDIPLPTLNISTENQSICLGETATFTATVSDPPASGLRYEWLINGNLQGTDSDTYTASNLKNGDLIQVSTYFLDPAVECYPFDVLSTDPISIAVIEVAPAIVGITASTTSPCQGDEVYFSSNISNAGMPTYDWLLNGQSTGINTSTFTLEQPNDGDEVELAIHVDVLCSPTPTVTSNKITLSVQAAPAIPLPTQVTFCEEEGEEAVLNAQAAGVVRYEWLPSGETSASITTTTPGSYQVTATTAAGCSSQASTTAVRLCPMKVYVPNAFSPNGDGRNEGFKIFGENIGNIDFKVFNRWGELIYHSTDFNDVWDGSYLGKTVPAGNYRWRLICNPIDTSQPIQDLKGELNIFRD